jgi:hypothetical protein
MFDRILPPLNGEFELLGELRGSFVAGAIGQRDISSRGFGSSGGFDSSNGFSSSGGFSSNGASAAMTSTASLQTSGAESEKESISTNSFSEPDG